jgi:hypothetical protein
MEKIGKAPLLDVYLQRLVDVIPQAPENAATGGEGEAVAAQTGDAAERGKPKSIN